MSIQEFQKQDFAGEPPPSVILPHKRKGCATAMIVTILLALFAIPSAGLADSPFRASLPLDGTLLGSSAVLAITGFLIEGTVKAPTPADIIDLSSANIPAFERGTISKYSPSISTMSEMAVAMTVAAPLALLASGDARKDWVAMLLMYTEVSAFSTFLVSFGKGGAQRFRPYAYNPVVLIDEKTTTDTRKSFFSGHTTRAFAYTTFAASLFDGYFPDSRYRPYIWAGALVTASSVGLMRYESGMHFPTDIVIGALVGTLVGYGIPWLHRANTGPVSAMPNGIGLTLSYPL